MHAQAIADARPEQPNHERKRQPQDHAAGDKGDYAGGMFHVVTRSVASRVE
jgi:hypothetical protein